MLRLPQRAFLAAMLPAEPAAPVRATRLDRACLVAAFAIPLAWFFIFDRSRPDYLVDEPGHLTNIYHILEAKPGWPEAMTMLPGYHYLVAALWQLHPPLKLLSLARLVPTLSALLALAAFAIAWRRLHRPGPATSLAVAGPATLLFSLLPIFQPFTALAYTDVPALAFTLLAVALHLTGRYALAALAFVPALLVRQTNVLWPAFLIAIELFAPLRLPPLTVSAPPPPGRAPGKVLLAEFFLRVRWLLLLLFVCAVAICLALATAGRLTPGDRTGNDLGVNPASFYFAALLVLLLGLPVWLANCTDLIRSAFARFNLHRTLVFIVLTAALAWGFANPHQWNRELFWDGCTFTLLRNWPLVWIEMHSWLRVAAGINLAIVCRAAIPLVARSPQPTSLACALAFGLLQPFTNSLVEPRYFIPAAAFTLLFLDLSPTTTRRLTFWWLLLCVLHAPFIARGLSLW